MTLVTLPPVDTNQRYSVPEGVAYLRTCRAKVYQMIKAGQIRVIKNGSRTLIPGSEIARLSRLPEQNAA